MNVIMKKRKDMRLTRKELSDKTGIHEQVIVRIELDMQEPKAKEISILGKALKLSNTKIISYYINKEEK